MIRAEVRYNSRLSEIERRFAIPLVEIAQQLVPGMLARIERGQSSTGTFAPIGAYSTPTPGKGLFWVAPGKPQPPGFIVRPTTGKLAGWAGYESYRDYARCLGNPPRNFQETRELLAALRIRVNGPGRVKVAFYGSHSAPEKPDGTGRRDSNANIAFLASRREPVPMLTPSREEIARVAQMFQSAVGAQMIGEAADAQSIRALGQRVTGLQRRLPAAARGRR